MNKELNFKPWDQHLADIGQNAAGHAESEIREDQDACRVSDKAAHIMSLEILWDKIVRAIGRQYPTKKPKIRALEKLICDEIIDWQPRVREAIIEFLGSRPSNRHQTLILKILKEGKPQS